MKKELRGKSIKSYRLSEIYDIKQVCEEYFAVGDNDADVEKINEEYGVDISAITNLENIANEIKDAILKKYNEDITPSIMFLYCFVSWYSESIKALDRVGRIDKRSALLRFDSILTQEIVKNIGVFLAQKYDKESIDEYILHAQYKLVSLLKKRIDSDNDTQLLELVISNIHSTINNCSFLGIVDEMGFVEKNYLLRLEYYPVDRVFRDVVDSFNSELNRMSFRELKRKEFYYFNVIKAAEVDFLSIKALTILKDGKRRNVYIANKPIDQAALIYLAKRLNNEFLISYPDRDKIMERCFNLIDSVPRLDNYTIYKFDFKSFFDSVEIKKVYEKYVEHSNLYSYEKELILKLAKKYKNCVQGLPVSNALIEIISKDFDEQVEASFSEDGLIFYKRYVDDCILIFNHKVERARLEHVIDFCRKMVFGNKVQLSGSKTSYQTKLEGNDKFDYLGYSFTRCFWNKAKKPKDYYYYYEFGIAEKKIEKYKKQLDVMFDSYLSDGNERLLLRRIQYYDSRIVFYNYSGSKYINRSTWDVRGIINSYRMLRRYVIYENDNHLSKKAGVSIPHRIEKETYDFLRYYIKEKRDSLAIIPQYLLGKGYMDHSLWNGFLKNKSIVFQPNIGWSNDYLNDRLLELGISPFYKSYYEKTRDYYTKLIKKL